MAGVIELKRLGKSDLTGKLSFRYFREYKYIMLMYEYDKISILTEPMKNMG